MPSFSPKSFLHRKSKCRLDRYIPCGSRACYSRSQGPMESVATCGPFLAERKCCWSRWLINKRTPERGRPFRTGNYRHGEMHSCTECDVWHLPLPPGRDCDGGAELRHPLIGWWVFAISFARYGAARFVCSNTIRTILNAGCQCSQSLRVFRTAVVLRRLRRRWSGLWRSGEPGLSVSGLWTNGPWWRTEESRTTKQRQMRAVRTVGRGDDWSDATEGCKGAVLTM
ncbi:hypothetical protein C8Q74DRAFT_827176 [Fomes fomentarius]|nr:hypothetical protein C8Q74DRAFT_827176 [Fomes fomentarius]